MKYKLFYWFTDPYYQKSEKSIEHISRINFIDQNDEEIKLKRLVCESKGDMQFRIVGKMFNIRNVFIN